MATGSPKFPSAPPGRVAPLWRRAIRARPAPPGGRRRARGLARGLRRRSRLLSRRAVGLRPRRRASVDIRVTGEELLANWFGWTNRTLEATAHPDDVPWGWRNYAYRGYLALQGVDRRLLESRLPAAMFYNLIVTARKP